MTNTEASLHHTAGPEGGELGTSDDGVDGLYALLHAARVDSVEATTISHQLSLYIDRLNEQGFDMVAYACPAEILTALNLDGLPKGVAVMGGAARAIMQQVRFGEGAAIRDVDLVAVGELCEGDENLEQLSRTYMPDDYSHGHGIELTQLDAYFATRDFTLNEVMIVDGAIVATRRGEEDLRNKVIRPTEYEALGWRQGIGPKLMVKALLLQTVFEEQYGAAVCEGFTLYQVSDFYMALGLNKAFQYGMPVAQNFLRKFGFRDVSQEAVLHYACELADETDFVFRNSPLAGRVAASQSGDFGAALFHDMPGDDAMERAIRLMGRYAGRLPSGADWGWLTK